MSARNVVLSIAVLEGVHLARLVDDFRDLLTERETDDSAVRRLTPSAYPDDQDAARAFAESTRDDLLDRRLADAVTVRTALAPFDVDVEPLSEDEALAPRDLVIAEDDLDSWLRTLTAIRLVIADRLGITEDDQTDEDGRGDIYDWLGYRLELLIQAADEVDERRGR
ncbi:DUF2017 family protein [Microbacterium sp. EST19A]|uniref:DUF2017 family protein n=1 Tax=Microbacterium sp. EST19A TaxID=2862681 RepID=UPI001CC1ABF7|nr:DUF2017 family protein [Microbacterium sp. EST19A]